MSTSPLPSSTTHFHPPTMSFSQSEGAKALVSSPTQTNHPSSPSPSPQTQSESFFPWLLGVGVLAVGGLGFIFRKPLQTFLQRFQKKVPPVLESLGDNATSFENNATPPTTTLGANPSSVAPRTKATTTRSSGGSSGGGASWRPSTGSSSSSRTTSPPAPPSPSPSPTTSHTAPRRRSVKWAGIATVLLLLSGWGVRSAEHLRGWQPFTDSSASRIERTIDEKTPSFEVPSSTTPEINSPPKPKIEAPKSKPSTTSEFRVEQTGRTLFPTNLPAGITPYHLEVKDGILRVMQDNQVLYSRTFSSDIDPKEYVKNPEFQYTEGFKDGSSLVTLKIRDKNLYSTVAIVPYDPRPLWDKLISADLFSSPVQVTERPISYNEYDNPIYGNATYLSTPWGGGSAKVHKSAAESELQKLLPDIKEAEDNVKAWETRLEEAKKASPPNAKHIEVLKNNHVAYWKDQLANLEVQRQKLKAKIEDEKNR